MRTRTFSSVGRMNQSIHTRMVGYLCNSVSPTKYLNRPFFDWISVDIRPFIDELTYHLEEECSRSGRIVEECTKIGHVEQFTTCDTKEKKLKIVKCAYPKTRCQENHHIDAKTSGSCKDVSKQSSFPETGKGPWKKYEKPKIGFFDPPSSPLHTLSSFGSTLSSLCHTPKSDNLWRRKLPILTLVAITDSGRPKSLVRKYG